MSKDDIRFSFSMNFSQIFIDDGENGFEDWQDYTGRVEDCFCKEPIRNDGG